MSDLPPSNQAREFDIDLTTRGFSDLAQFVPESWIKPGEPNLIIVVCYSVFLSDTASFTTPQLIEFANVRAAIFTSSLRFMSAKIEFDPSVQSGNSLQARIEGQKTKPKSVHLFLLSPLKESEKASLRSKGRQDINDIASLLAVCNGRNSAYEKIFEVILDLNKAQSTSSSSAVVNPLSFAKPDFSMKGVELVSTLETRIDGLDDKERVRFSLHWFLDAVYEIDHVDSLLKFWIALEAIAMRDSNVRPLVEALAKGYQISNDEAKTKFKIGRIQNLRSEIVHTGKLPVFSHALLDYLQAIYVDLLFTKTGLSCSKQAEKVLSHLDLDKTLKSI